MPARCRGNEPDRNHSNRSDGHRSSIAAECFLTNACESDLRFLGIVVRQLGYGQSEEYQQAITKQLNLFAGLLILAVPWAASAQSILDTLRGQADPLESVVIPETDLEHPLHYLLRTGQYEAALDVLPLAAEVNEPDQNGDTPLTIAAKDKTADAYDMVKALLERGADPMRTDKAGLTALHYAAHAGTLAVVELLVDRYGADINAPSEDVHSGTIDQSETPLAFAARAGHLRIIRFLEARGAAVESADLPVLRLEARFQRHYSALTEHLEDAPDSMSATDRREARLRAVGQASLRALEELGAPPEMLEYQRKQHNIVVELLVKNPQMTYLEAYEQALGRVVSQVDMAAYKAAADEFGRKLGDDR